MDEKSRKMAAATDAVRISDDQLDEVTGGTNFYHETSTDKYYHWKGWLKNGQKYLCPCCGRALSSTFGFNYSCKPCNKSWVDESWLRLNHSSGLWEEITKEQYEIAMRIDYS